MQENLNACKVKDKNVWTQKLFHVLSTYFSVK